jgi:hypothetical protein
MQEFNALRRIWLTLTIAKAQLAQYILCIGIALVSSKSKPAFGLKFVLVEDISHEIRVTQPQLGIAVAVFRELSRFGKVLN